MGLEYVRYRVCLFALLMLGRIAGIDYRNRLDLIAVDRTIVHRRRDRTCVSLGPCWICTLRAIQCPIRRQYNSNKQLHWTLILTPTTRYLHNIVGLFQSSRCLLRLNGARYACLWPAGMRKPNRYVMIDMTFLFLQTGVEGLKFDIWIYGQMVNLYWEVRRLSVPCE